MHRLRCPAQGAFSFLEGQPDFMLVEPLLQPSLHGMRTWDRAKPSELAVRVGVHVLGTLMRVKGGALS
jgi:hypothetical protein